MFDISVELAQKRQKLKEAVKMGKHKNSRQEKLFLEFMEKNTDLAKGFLKGDKSRSDSLWTTLMDILNSEGPPKKDASGWRKVWFDWKCNIRKKLAHNKREVKATGGGLNNILPITTVEDAIAKIAGIYSVVEGIKGGKSFGVTQKESEINDTVIEKNTNEEVLQEITNAENTINISASSSHEPHIRTSRKSQNSIEKYMETQKDTFHKILIKLNESIDIASDNRTSLKRIYRALEKQTETIKEQNIETSRHHLEIEKMLLEKNEIKKRRIEIEEIKLDIETRK